MLDLCRDPMFDALPALVKAFAIIGFTGTIFFFISVVVYKWKKDAKLV